MKNLLKFILLVWSLQILAERNPFYFSSQEKIPNFECRAVAKVDDSKYFAIISDNGKTSMVKEGDRVAGYKLITISGDYIIVQDDKNNEFTLHLK